MSTVGSLARHTAASLLLCLIIFPGSPAVAQAALAAGSRKLVERLEPVYPALARRNGISGSVRLRVEVAPDGRPKDVEVLGGNPVLAETAKDSVKKWKWAATEHESTEVVEVKFDTGS